MRLTIAFLFTTALAVSAADLHVGIIGTDTSHVPAFTQLMNDPSAPGHVAGARVVAAYKGGSSDIESSRTRTDGYAEEIQKKYGVEIVPDIATLLSKVDVVMVESVDGRPHLAQVKPVIAAHKPVFIDKPLASTREDAREIARLAREAGVPWFSSSSLRFADFVVQMRVPNITGAFTWGPGPFEEHHQLELSWYAIHPIEVLYTILGTGCEEVTRVSAPDADEISCKWSGGRIGAVRALRPYGSYGAVVFLPKERVMQSPPDPKVDYQPLVREIVQFFITGKPPVPNDETLEIFAFMDAAQRSKEAGGKPVRLR